jgi:hypothetical protein
LFVVTGVLRITILGPQQAVLLFAPARFLAEPIPLDFEKPVNIGSCDKLSITGNQRRRRTTVHPSNPSFRKTEGSRTGLTLILVLQADMPNGIEHGDHVPSDDMSSIAAVAAIR